MNKLENWKEITKGMFRYVCAANVCYEMHILHWDFDTDILTAKRLFSLLATGDRRTEIHSLSGKPF